MAERGPLILVIEDSVDVSAAVEILLSAHGYRVIHVADGKLGLQAVRTHHPDVILLDMMMPEMDGLDFLQRLASEPDPPPVIGLSGFDSYREQALARGARAFLRKPVDVDALLGAVRSVLSGREADADTLAANERAAAQARDRARAIREELLEGVNLDSPDLIRRLRALIDWMASYFDVASAFFNLARAGEILVHTASSRSLPYLEGSVLKAESTFCSSVIAAEAPMILVDTSRNPAYAVHPAVGTGVRFYAAVPVRLSSGVVIGTLGLLDPLPREFHGEDLVLLERLAQVGAARIEAIRTGRKQNALYRAPGVFRTVILRAIVQAEQSRVDRAGGAVHVAMVDVETPDGHERLAGVAHAAAGRGRFAVGVHGHGVLVLVSGDGEERAARARLERALESIGRIAAVHGVGLATYRQGDALDVGQLLAVADLARARALQQGGGTVEHWLATVQHPPAGPAL